MKPAITLSKCALSEMGICEQQEHGDGRKWERNQVGSSKKCCRAPNCTTQPQLLRLTKVFKVFAVLKMGCSENNSAYVHAKRTLGAGFKLC